MKKIVLTRGYEAYVDDDDYPRVMQYKWRALPTKSGKVYAATGRTTTLLHRFIMSAQKGDIIDHINGNTMDNRKSNLRFCTHTQNIANTNSVRGKSKYKGVTIRPNGKYKSELAGKYLGVFKTEHEAAKAYNLAAYEKYGEFARPNIITTHHKDTQIIAKDNGFLVCAYGGEIAWFDTEKKANDFILLYKL